MPPTIPRCLENPACVQDGSDGMPIYITAVHALQVDVIPVSYIDMSYILQANLRQKNNPMPLYQLQNICVILKYIMHFPIVSLKHAGENTPRNNHFTDWSFRPCLVMIVELSTFIV